MAEYVIRHTEMQDDYFLKEVKKERSKDLQPVHSKRGRKGKCVESTEEITPRGESIATWTKDLTQAKYYGSRKDAETTIRRWPVLRFAEIVEAMI